jgi:hypothetical protein
MKTSLLRLLLFIALGLTQSNAAEPAPAAPTRYVIGLSPFLDKSVKDDVYRRIVGMILEDLPLKSSLAIYDAYNLTSITSLEVPDARAFKSGKTRANQFGEPILKLKNFLAATHERPIAPKLNLDQAIRFPQFLDFVGENLVPSSGALTLLVLGSPLYMDPKEPGFSMMDGYFPSDGHILATRDQSIYALKNRSQSLQSVVVHFGYFGDPWLSAIHQEKIVRFWSLYVKQQSGRLGVFSGDLATLFTAARTGSVPERRDELDPAQTKVEMLRITRDIGVADWITRDLPAARPKPPIKTSGPMKVGIRWEGDIDLDLYASATQKSERLYFEHTRAPEGYYFKDHRHSPEREYEFIEFESPVDLWRVQAAVNFYAGNLTDGPTGEVRVEFEGKIYSGRFDLSASRGNKGREGSSERAYWATLDIPQIVGLREQRADLRRGGD